MSRLLAFVAVPSLCLVMASAVAGSRLAAAQEPAEQQGAAAATPSAFPTTVASPSAAAPAPEVGFRTDPYGLITTNATYLLGNSSNNPDVPGWATAGDSAFYFTARHTRIGARGSWVAPASGLGVARVTGLIEADFNGAFLGQGLGYFFPLPRLRLATATAEWHSVRFSFGQDWSVLAPINPVTALHTGVPGFSTSGNLWARIPQLRVDGVIGFGGPDTQSTWRLIWALAAVAQVQADAIPASQAGVTAVRIPQGGERSLAPAGEARVAMARDLFGKPFEIGASGHFGNREIPFAGGTVGRLNGAVALDLTLPLPGMLALRGEGFWGNGLDGFAGGISQGIAFTTDATGAIASVGNGIAAFGGWAQLSWAPIAWLTVYVGGGADKPNTNDLSLVSAAANRTLNVAGYGEVSYALARGFALWLEYNYMSTEYQAASTQRTHVLALSGQLAF